MTIPSWAVPGAKVVCVKVGPWNLLGGPPYYGPDPAFGEICTIERAIRDADGIWLALSGYDKHVNFRIAHFRPVVADDIEATLFRSKRQPVSREVEQA